MFTKPLSQMRRRLAGELGACCLRWRARRLRSGRFRHRQRDVNGLPRSISLREPEPLLPRRSRKLWTKMASSKVPCLLLDTNALLALAWPNHQFHIAVMQRLETSPAPEWRTCLLTQLGFARLSSNPAIVGVRMSPGQALDVLSRLDCRPTSSVSRDSAVARDNRWHVPAASGTSTGYRRISCGGRRGERCASPHA